MSRAVAQLPRENNLLMHVCPLQYSAFLKSGSEREQRYEAVSRRWESSFNVRQLKRRLCVTPGIQHYHSHGAEEGANSCIRLHAWTVWSVMSFCRGLSSDQSPASSLSNCHYSFVRVGQFSCASVRSLLAFVVDRRTDQQRQFPLSSFFDVPS